MTRVPPVPRATPAPVPATRAELLAEYFALFRRLEGETGDELTPSLRADVLREIELREAYVASLRRRAVSRCPFSGSTVDVSIDDSGLDGLWWSYESPARPLDPAPPTLLALAGAVALAEPVETAPFLTKPGPEAPFVVPRLLRLAGAKAVVSSLPIGRHTGYAVAYFADPVPGGVERFNTWGSNEYRVTAAGRTGWASVAEDPDDYDFELEPWVAAGRLAWIAPGDASLTIRTDAAACPYLGLAGRRSVVRIREGRVWTPEELR